MVRLTTPKSLFLALPLNPLVSSCHFVQEVEDQRLPEPALGGADEAGIHLPDFELLQDCSVWTVFFVHWCSGSEPEGIADWTCWWWQGGWWRVGGHKTTFPRSSLAMVRLTTPKSLFCALPFNPLVPSCHFVQEVEEQRLPEPALGGADEAGTHLPDFELLQNCSVWTVFFVHWCSGSEPAGIADWTCWWWQGGWWRVGGHKTTFPRSSLAMVRLTTPKSLFCALPFNPLVPSCHFVQEVEEQRLPEPALGGADEAGIHLPDFESLQDCSVWIFSCALMFR